MSIGLAHTALAMAMLAVASVSSERLDGQAAAADEDCRVATQLWRLSRIYGTADLPVIEKKAAVCSSATTGKILWPDGKAMKSSGGTWSYPNGNTARTSGGAWSYPNRMSAKTSGDTWSYPDGNTAGRREAHGHGQIAIQSSWRGCDPGRERVEPTKYTELSAEIGNAKADEEVIAAVELAWLAR